MEWDPITVLAVLGLVCLASTPFVVTGVLEVMLALGLASLTTALFVQLGWLTGNWPLLLTVLAGLTFGYALLIWRPMRKLMKRSASPDAAVSDWIGLTLQLPADFDADTMPFLHYSGVRWRVHPHDPTETLQALQSVIVVRASVGEVWVRTH